jgi:plasmid replication initiation protein
MEQEELTIVKANKVIEASYKLSLHEQRVLLACINQIDSKGNLTIDDGFEIKATDINVLWDLNNVELAYDALALAVKNLYVREVDIDDYYDPVNPHIKKLKTRWITSIAYTDQASVIVYFEKKMLRYLSELKDKFTEYKIENVRKFKSVYSIRLYELLLQWAKIGNRELEVDWLKSVLQVEDKYTRVTDLYNWIIKPSVAEINKHSNIRVECTKRKAGRVITHFCFSIKKVEEKPKTSKVTPINKPKANQQPPDNAVVLAEHQALSAKPEPTKKAIDPATKQKIAGARAAIKR